MSGNRVDFKSDNGTKSTSSTAIEVVDPSDVNYPRRLREVSDKPPKLYVWGNVALASRPILGVVGTRRCTQYGRGVTRQIVDWCVENQIVVASGLAEGIDAQAHSRCLDRGGQTIAVLGNGLDICYPPLNRDLQNKIANSGLLISQFKRGTIPRKWQFPQRNELIANLSWVVVAVESHDRGGALITARLAEQGHTLCLSVPGPVGSSASVGTNKLISDGIRPYLGLETLNQVFQEQLTLLPPGESLSFSSLTSTQEQVLGALEYFPVALEQVFQHTGLPIPIVMKTLYQLAKLSLCEEASGRWTRSQANSIKAR